ncbi:glycogen debranching protein GlgX [Reyranella sp.]|uniref:glycogen debranching protein GlgX n=1 Tax=Reyranella sp. TaxID=1929291 RepID=UPI000BDD090B|nr:glycogen debranching protein GlgX [Reyranella sp.]OYY40438.1 MAG: glycogen debranching enzyme GlgX [Rhodospirillales bacterium 35-66-84]OYZ93054.1 MAG: glycogen debranching enzyme GlgX [Rhodospirillales bacterium 24-66-33]OZB24183.1 MAG: glycogen debranching enzyme GlgX [Rhodospirillales bacterium 39-66-50]HQS18777.1 glycogen debranching protein GlgX [Reyranella sp.]HQT14913.1 glycogen debranching protein GlgX [Reyranella sp.]
MAASSWPDRLLPGSPYPLGATWDGLGTNFAVFSAHATRIELCLFDPSGRRQLARFDLPECTDEVWHGYLPNARAGLAYGYRAHGPYEPQAGHRFNPHKLLLDPYARRLTGEMRNADALYGYRVNSPRADLSFDRRDSGPGVMKGVVADESFNWADDRPPAVPWSDTVIYETHVRGVSVMRQDLRPHERGTFAALGDPVFIDHLRRLGVTTVELLPVHAFVQDRSLLEKGLRNYWGYNSLGFFAPEPRYLSDGTLDELRIAVRRLHAAGLELILDVVYNHTAEGSELGPTLSFRGLDNASYYRLLADNPRHCINDTGTGNTLNLSTPRVLQMVMDSLRYWVTAFHVDGFRFDLGVTLGREAHGFDPCSGFFDAIRQDPVLQKVKLISEPWDIGPGGYQLGNHPPGFAEWNDRFRDGVRRYWRGDPGQRADFAARLAGSSDLFDRRHRRPWASINYVASHDGFTLLDAVSYEERHNEANGEDNRDGHGENYSSNWGVEGPSDDPAILDTRHRLQRAMLATLFLAQGTPMLLGGDEFGRSQNGNNNAYCQDNEASWFDWSLLEKPDGQNLADFVSRIVALRHKHPVLRAPRFLHGLEHPAEGVADIAWFDASGEVVSTDSWNNVEDRCLVLRRASFDGGSVTMLTAFFNAGATEHKFVLPQPRWPTRIVLDSAAPEAAERDLQEDELMVGPRSVVLALATRPQG